MKIKSFALRGCGCVIGLVIVLFIALKLFEFCFWSFLAAYSPDMRDWRREGPAVKKLELKYPNDAARIKYFYRIQRPPF